MKKVTTRELMTMKAEKRKELMKEKFEIGERVAGVGGRFYATGVYIPYYKLGDREDASYDTSSSSSNADSIENCVSGD